jgi:hypothetical protein
MTRIPPDHLSYPVRLSCEKGNLGSGFLLQTDNNIYLVTARHVLKDIHDNLYTDFLTISTSVYKPQHVSTTINVDLKEIGNNLTFHKKEDVCVINLMQIMKQEQNTSYQLRPFVSWQKEDNIALSLVHYKDNVWLFEHVLVSSDAYLYGYPTSLDIYKELGFDMNTPLIRKGIVSGLNIKDKRIIMDCEVHYGNSGGPVTQIIQTPKRNYHKVLGIASQFIPYRETFINPRNNLKHEYALNSGYSLIVSIDHILELIN